MANYSLVINSKFKPFSFQELLQPALMATQAHQAVEEAYADLSTKASIWDKMTNEATDQKAHALYKKYADDLQSYSDQLAQYGLTPTSRQAMLNMRSRYAQEIAPIERAYQLRGEDIKRQQEAYDKSNGRVLFTRNARETSLDKYLNGVSPDYSSINLDSVVSTGVAGGKALSSRYINTKEGKRFNGDYNNLITETGLTPEQAIEVLRGSGKYPEFERFINDTLANYSHGKYNTSDQNTIKNALMEGINLGIAYNRTEQLHNNWRAQQALTHYYHELEADNAGTRAANNAREIARIKAERDKTTLFNPAIPQGVVGTRDQDLDRVKGLKKVIGKDGQVYVSTERLDNASKAVEKAKKELSDYEKKVGKTVIAYYKLYRPGVPPSTNKLSTSGTRTLAQNMDRSISESGWRHWQALQAATRKAEGTLQEEQKYLSDLANKYSGYGDNMHDRILTGVKAKQAHLGQQKLFYGLNANNSSHTELKSAIGRLVSAGASVVSTKNGNPITGSDLTGDSGILKNENTAIGVTVKGDKVFVSLNDEEGKEYKVSNIRHIDDFNERFSYVNKKLGDFYSKRTTGNIYNVPTNFTGSWGDALASAIQAGKAEHPRGTNMYAATVSVTLNGQPEIVNIVSDGQQVYYQTQTDELYNQGKFREAIIRDTAAGALVDLLPTLAHTPEAKEDEK